MRPLVLLAFAGCLIPNPDFDRPGQGDSAGGTTLAGTTGGEVTGVDVTSAGATTSMSGDPTGGASGSTGAASLGSTGAASDSGSTGDGGTTGDACGGCKPCEVCEDGSCVPVQAATPCAVGEDLPCDKRLYGYVSSGCAVHQPSDVAQCDGQGTCSFVCSDAPGEVVIHCGEGCRPEPNNCVDGVDVATVSPADVCVFKAHTPACHDACEPAQMGHFAVFPRWCDNDGQCAPAGPPMSCENYACKQGGDGCETSCMSDQQCKADVSCTMGECKK